MESSVEVPESHPAKGAGSKERAMTEKSLEIGEIEVTVSGLFTTHHTFETAAGVLGEFTFPAFSQCATFKARGGYELLMQKTHCFIMTAQT